MFGRRVARLGREILRAWNARDTERVAAYFASDFRGIDVGNAAPQRGPDDVRRMVEQYLRAFPDLRFSVEDSLVDGNRVALIWTARGTHAGALMRIPPTFRPTEVRGVSILTIEDGKITRALHHWDVAALLRDLGLLPELWDGREVGGKGGTRAEAMK